MVPRWSVYYLNSDYDAFWRHRLANKNTSVCVIVGVGFDPRSLLVLERIAQSGNTSQVGCVALHLHPPSILSDETEKIDTHTKVNRERLTRFAGVTCVGEGEVQLHDADGYAIGGRTALKIINALLEKISAYQDIVVDISGLPRTIFFPLISFLCSHADKGKIRNLHVAVSEDPSLDEKIRGREYAKADFLYPFRLQSPKKLVWLPVVGQNAGGRLQKIYDQIRHNCIEVCPVPPFPAKSLRRADDILVELNEILFERFLISRSNILLCGERMPFDIYRKIVQIDEYYRRELATSPALGEITTVVSPLSSKMLSLGMLLAAIERHLPVCYVETGSYSLDIGGTEQLTVDPSVVPIEVWLTGEPYQDVSLSGIEEPA